MSTSLRVDCRSVVEPSISTVIPFSDLAVTAAEATDTFLPTLVMEVPAFSSLSPTSEILSRVVLHFATRDSSDFKASSNATISHWRASYYSCVISPF